MKFPAIPSISAINPPLRQNGQQQNFNRRRASDDESVRHADAKNNKPAADFVFRGEYLNANDQQRQYRSQFNQQVPPQNRVAIDRYLSSLSSSIDYDPRGQLLDRFV